MGMVNPYGATRWRFSRLPHLSCMEVLCLAGFESLPHNTSILCEPFAFMMNKEQVN